VRKNDLKVFCSRWNFNGDELNIKYVPENPPLPPFALEIFAELKENTLFERYLAKNISISVILKIEYIYIYLIHQVNPVFELQHRFSSKFDPM
jgi:hypothetical protein